MQTAILPVDPPAGRGAAAVGLWSDVEDWYLRLELEVKDDDFF